MFPYLLYFGSLKYFWTLADWFPQSYAQICSKISGSLSIAPTPPHTLLQSWVWSGIPPFRPYKKNWLSSANNKWDTAGQALATFIHVSCFSLSAFLIFAIKASVHMINKYGERGSPWRNSLCGVMCPRGWPFKRIWYWTEDMHSIISWVHIRSNPILRSKAWIKLYSTLS